MSNPSSLERIFFAALEKGSFEERAAYLDEVCANDPDLRQRVEKMSAAQSQAGSFLESPPPLLGATIDSPIQETPGTFIGHYKLLEPIGEGGFGTVFMAEQFQPVRRKVALKILKAGMDTRQVVARFEAERQALAIMDHPNIAKVFDGGVTPSGRPYLVMELVKGVPITEFCDQNHLTPRQRLELFLQVCQAVQHAHQKGIIHRDIKPSNILVSRHDTTPVVKVIDFGVAKAMGQELTDKTLFTAIAQMIGTPLYMSPEQAGMSDLDVDTRSDIYSLGVLLYELLTGTTPFTKDRFQQAAYDEIRRIIREEEPPKPSTRLFDSKDSLPSISAQRQMEPKKLTKLVRGELDWIVMKALEKNRNRRYETANSFAMDVQRYLTDEPVEASPPGAGYRLRKFARRHRKVLATAAAFMLVLLAGTAVSAWLAVKATQAGADARANQQIAQDEAALATAVKEFLLKDLLQLAAARQQSRERASGVKMDPDLKVRDLVLRAAQKIEGKFKDQPLVEAEIRATLGWTLHEIGRPDLAIAQLLRVCELYKAHRGPDHSDMLENMVRLSNSYAAVGKHTEALKLREETLELRKAKLGPVHRDTLLSRINLANSYHAMGQHAEALNRYEETLALQKDTLGHDHLDTLRTMSNLAVSYDVARRKQEALKLREKTLQLMKDTLGPDDLDTLLCMNNLAISYETAGRTQDALKLDEEAFQLRRTKLGPDHPDTLVSMSNLALSYKALGRLDEAIKLTEQALALWKVKRGPDHPDTIMSMYNLGVLRRRAMNYAGAEELLLGCQAAVATKRLGIHPHVRANVARELTRLYDAWNKPAEADKWLRQMPPGKQIEYGLERHYVWPLLWGWPRR